MLKITAKVLAALAAFLLIFCIAFTAVSLTASNTSYFEKEFQSLGIADSMGVQVSDLSRAIQALTGYMNGTLDSIDVDVMIGGELTPMFTLDIEHTHMEEVRTLWQRLTGMRGLVLLAAAILALIAISLNKKDWKRTLAYGYLWGFGIFILLFAFLGTWAGMNFSSFWSFFHTVIFPSSDTWQLPAESRMIQMLPETLFADVAGRCALLMLLPTLFLCAGAIVWLLLIEKKERKAAGEDNIISIEAEEEDALLAVGEPDLIFVHKKANMPVSRRKQLVMEMEERNAMEAEAGRIRGKAEESLGVDPSLASSDEALKVTFQPFSGNAEEEDSEEE